VLVELLIPALLRILRPLSGAVELYVLPEAEWRLGGRHGNRIPKSNPRGRSER
jgi:hypothetical protein